MRTVFTSRADVAHLWAHQLQNEARHSSGNYFFEGDTIYSYGHHYPCGTIIKNRRGQQAYVLNTSKSSNTTCRHMGYTCGAIAWDAITFNSDGCKAPSSYTNKSGKTWNYDYEKAVSFVAYHLNGIYECFQKQRKARVRSYVADAMCHLNEIRNFIGFFDLHRTQTWCERGGMLKKRPAIIDYFKSPANAANLKRVLDCGNERFAYISQLILLLDEYRMLVGEVRENMDGELRELMMEFWNDGVSEDIEARVKKMEAAERRAIIKQNKKRIEAAKKSLEKWREGKIDWFDTYAYPELYKALGWNAALRINKDHIETSKGINLSFDEGKRLWAIIQRFEKNGSFHHELALDLSGHQWKFNKYEGHVLTAGCHQIAYSECKAIANQMGW